MRIKITKKHFVYSFLFNTAIALSFTGFALERSETNVWETFFSNFVFAQAMGMTCFFCLCLAFAVFKTERPVLQLLVVVGAILAGSVSVTSMAVNLSGSSLGDNVLAYFRNGIKSLVFGAVIIFFFVSRERISRANALISEEKIKRLDLEKKAVEADLQLLQSQTEPHFLFNSLSNVMSLMDSDPRKAKTMMGDFIDFLRASASVRRSSTVTISEELELIGSYLGILKIRMGNRLEYTIDADESVLGHMIPPLLVQPLVENAVKHGLELKSGGGAISIRCSREADMIRIQVSDSGAGINVNKASSGIGLLNIRKRLELLHGDKGRLVLTENIPSGVNAVLEIPHGAD